MRKEMSSRLQKTLLGFASGVMVAASVWSLLIPGIDISEGSLTAGFDRIFPRYLLSTRYRHADPHLHIGESGPEGPRKSGLSRTAMLALAMTIHNLPEGMAVSVVLAGALQGGLGISSAGAIAMAVSIAVQNIRKARSSRCRCGRKATAGSNRFCLDP